MRRRDREITNNDRINEIINTCKYCRIGLYDEENDEVCVECIIKHFSK